MKLWTTAAGIAARTPATRNRLVDCLRAASILAVISGHWLLTAPFLTGDGLELGNMLELKAYTQWLSWAFQVMPIFFLVGGYANGVSWRASQRDCKPFGEWLDSRLRRLVLPVLALIAAWAAIAPAGRALGVDAGFLQEVSKIALVPTWFLAIYAIIVLLVPLAHAAWRRFGFGSFVAAVLLAVADDAAFFRGYTALGWFNYIFVWIAVHQLGFAWLDERIPRPSWRFALGVSGLCLLCALTVFGPYPIPMISMPGAELSNTLPPKLPLLALAIAQAGIILAFEAPLRRWLARPAPWTLTVLLNGMIMTIYLWHSTAMVLVVASVTALGGPGFSLEPGNVTWWLTRPIWLAIYIAALAALAPVVARFERSPPPAIVAPAWRLVSGALLCCAGLALLSYFGLGGTAPSLSTQILATLTPFAGAILSGLLIQSARAEV